MEELDLSKIRGRWQETDALGTMVTAAGDDTVTSIHMVAGKVNEIIRFLQKTAPKEKETPPSEEQS